MDVILVGLYTLANASLSHLHIKHPEKICSVCGGHLISIYFPPTNWEGYYALLLKDGREIMPTCRCKNPPTI